MSHRDGIPSQRRRAPRRPRGSAVRGAGVATAALLAAVVFFAPSHAAAGSWKGQEVTKEGALHVLNPAEGMESPAEVQLEELWRIGGYSDLEEEFFGVINRVETDEEGNVYLLDSQLSEIKVFSPDGEYLNTLGREGEGPGEFRNPSDMFFVPGGDLGVMQMAPGKIELLTRQGEPDGQFPIPGTEDGGFRILIGGRYAGDRLILAGAVNAFQEGSFTQTRYLAAVDAQGNELARFHEEDRTMNFANMVIDEKIWDTFDRRWTVGPGGRVFAVTQHPDYEINVWNPDGTLDRVIEREYERLGRSAEDKARVHKIYEAFTQRVPNATIKVEDNFKDVDLIFVRDSGELWVLSSRGSELAPEGTLGVFDVFDKKGRFVRQVTLKGEGDPDTDGYFFVKDRLYVVTDFLQAAMAMQGGGTGSDAFEEEPEPMAVICYRIGSQMAGMTD
jgi:hypothetical protein